MALERVDIASCDDKLQIALHRARYDFALQRVTGAESLLEIGTGLGVFTLELLGISKNYKGVDFDPNAVAQTRTRTGGVADVAQGDAKALAFQSSQFSHIVCLEVLEHLGDFRAGVAEIHRCLRPGGAVISVPYRKRGGKSEINEHHLYEPGESELVGILKNLFANVDVFYHFFEETPLMTLARKLHLRRAVGLAEVYSALTAGEPRAVARLKIGRKANGLKLGLLIVASSPKKGLASDVASAA